MHSLRAIGFVLLTLVLVPAAAFLAYEVVTLGENERLMAKVYDQQLETLLFSVNQHAWDVSGKWADGLSRVHSAHAHSFDAVADAAQDFLAENPDVQAVVLADSLRRNVRRVARPGDAVPTPSLEALPVARLLQQHRAGYRRLEAVTADTTDGTPAALLLFFVPEAFRESPVHLVGFALDTDAFVEAVLVPKLQEVARSTYRVGLFRDGQAEPVYATGAPEAVPFLHDSADQARRLWVLPDYTIGIRPVGASIGELVRQRFYRNLVLVFGLVLLLFAAAWVAYRSIRRQVQLARMKSDFVSNVSHELRTPLALIRMYAETLEMGRVPTEARRQEYLRVISSETERLTHLVNNILNFSRMEAGHKTYAEAPVDLNEVAAAVYRLYAPTLEAQGFRFELRLAEELPPLRGDREAMTEALINLVDNAVKYSGSERRVEVETGRRGGDVFVAVRDHGIGIAPEEQRRIFEKFYRVSTGLVHDTRGTGLGLAIVDHIVQAHGGRVALESRPGAGSRFSLLFPVGTHDAPRAAARTTPPARVPDA